MFTHSRLKAWNRLALIISRHSAAHQQLSSHLAHRTVMPEDLPQGSVRKIGTDIPTSAAVHSLP